MHSKHFPQDGVYIHHNGDYSGDATIVIEEGFGRQEGEFKVLCRVLQVFGADAMRDKIVSMIEDVEL